MPFNPIYDSQFIGGGEKLVDITKSPYKLEGVSAPTPLYTPNAEYLSGTPVGESRYDTPIDERSVTDAAFINQQRADLQPEYAKAFNATIGGIISGLATAVEDIGYTADIENGIKRLADVEQVETNFLSANAQAFKKWLYKEMPIYKEDPNKAWDWGDSGSYWEALRGVVDSAVGFAIPGTLAAKGVASTIKGVKTLGYLSKLTEPSAQIVQSIGAGFITNYGEGKMMALEMYDNSINAMKENYYNNLLKNELATGVDPGIAQFNADRKFKQALDAGLEKEFQDIAGKEADIFQRNNMAFIVTDAIGLHGIAKGAGFTRNLIPTRKGLTSLTELSSNNLLLQGAKEGAEEIGQNIMQSEREWAARTNAKLQTDDPIDFGERILKYATSDKALLEGAMGFLGGGVQRVMMKGLTGQYGADYNNNLKDRIQKQNEQIQANTTFLQQKLSDVKTANELLAEAIKRGDTSAENYVKTSATHSIIMDNLQRGTIENLERQVDDMLEQSNDPTQQEQLRKVRSEIPALEKMYLKYSGYINSDEMFQNRLNEKALSNRVKDLTTQESVLKNDFIQTARSLVDEYNTKNPDNTVLVDFSDNAFNTKEFTTNKDLNTQLVRLGTDYYQAAQLKDLHVDKVNQLNVDYAAKTSPEYQVKLAENIKEVGTKIKEAQKKQEEAAKVKEAEVKKAERISKAKAKQEAAKPKEPTITQEEPSLSKEAAQGFDFGDETVEVLEDIPQEPTSKWESLVNNAVNEKELDAITTQSSDAGEYTSDLLDSIFKKRQELKLADVDNKMWSELLEPVNLNLPEYAQEELLRQVERAKNLGIIRNIFTAAFNGSTAAQTVTQLNLSNKSTEEGSDRDMVRAVRAYLGIPSLDNMQEFRDWKDKVKAINARYNAERDEILKLSKSETQESSTQEHLEDTITSNYTSGSEDEVGTELRTIDNDVSKENGEVSSVEGDTITYEYDRVVTGYNVFAYLSRLYQQVFKGNSLQRVDIDNFINSDMVDKSILSPNKFKPGSKITIKIDDKPTKIYLPNTKDEVEWENYVQSKGTGFINSQEYWDLVPMAIYDESGNKIAHLHSLDWINPSNVAGDIAENKKELSKIRQEVAIKGKYDTVITEKKIGKLFKTSDKKPIKLGKAMPKPILAIVRNGKLSTSRGKEFMSPIANKSLREGNLYTIVQMGDKSLAIPLIHDKLGTTPNVIKSIVDAVKVFATNDKANPLVKAINSSMGINILTKEGIESYLKSFINIYNTGGKDLDKFDMKNISSDKYILTVNNGTIDFARGKMASKRAFINTGTSGKLLEANLKLLSEHLANMYFNADLDMLENAENKKVVVYDSNGSIVTDNYMNHLKNVTNTNILSANIGTEESPEYTSFIQPVIRFKSDIKDEVKPVEPTKGSGMSLEDKIADIERRRQEDLEKVKLTLTDEFSPKYTSSSEVLSGVAKYFIKNFNWAFKGSRKYSLYVSKERNRLELDINNLEVNLPDGSVIGIYGGGKYYPRFSPQDIINAKYDAELALAKPVEAINTPKANTLGFDNLGNIGNQGLAIMEADILSKGIHRINNISKATPAQTDKIKSDIEQLKNKYPSKGITSRVQNTSLIVEVTNTPKSSTVTFTTEPTVSEKNKEEFTDFPKDLAKALTEVTTVVAQLTNKLTKGLYNVKNTTSVIKLKTTGEFESIGAYDEKHEYDVSMTELRTQDKRDYEQVKKEFDADVKYKAVLTSSLFNNIVTLANKLGGLEQLKKVLGSYTFEQVGTISNVEYSLTSFLKYAINNDILEGIETIINNELAKVNNTVTTTVSNNKNNEGAITPKPKPKSRLNKEGDGSEVYDAPLTSDIKVQLENDSATIYAPELGAAKQNAIVSYVKGKAINKLFTSEDTTREGVFSEIKTEYEDMIKTANSELEQFADDVEAVEDILACKKAVEDVLNNWNIIEATAIEQIARINNVTVDLEESDAEITFDENQLESERFGENRSFTMDARNKLSSKVKRLFGAINKINPDGAVATNYLGQEVTLPFDKVYNTLQALTANQDPDFNILIKVLENNTQAFPWLKQVVDVLKTSEDDVKNQFVTGMTNHKHNMKFVMWSRNKDGNYRMVQYDADANELSQRLVSDWTTKYSQSELFIQRFNPKTQEYFKVKNPEGFDTFMETMASWIKSPDSVTNQDLTTWLNTIGIEVPVEAIQYMRDNKVRRLDFNQQLTSKNGIFRIIYDNLNKLDNDTDIMDDSVLLTKDSSIKDLAKVVTKFKEVLASNSFRAGTKSVYSYGNNKFLVNQMRRLVQKTKSTYKGKEVYTNKLLTDLASTSFTRNSYLLKGGINEKGNVIEGALLVENGNYVKAANGEYIVNENSPLLDNLGYATASLEPLKEMGAKSRDNSEMNNLSPMAIEIFKLANLHADQSDNSGNNNRVVTLNYPTTSDKTTVMLVRSVAFHIGYDIDGNITDDTLDRLYDLLVLPELERIMTFKALEATDNTPNIKGYKGGATKFLLLPLLNDIPELFDSNINQTEGVRDKVKKVLKEEYLDKLISEKLDFWNKVGIGASNVDKKNPSNTFKHKFLYTKGKAFKGVEEANYSKVAATDMVIQYLVGNAEAFKNFIGDPAIYWKPDRNSKTITEQVEDTFNNIGKRLAADIAPGTEIADAMNNNYIQIFAEDKASQSKEYNNRLKKILSNDDRRAYGKGNGLKGFDATDAQEYTTWREHLYILKQQGLITQQDYNEAFFTLAAGKKLSYDMLGRVLQPLKPVYVGNALLEGKDVINRYYIKSSSFPLIPQLTGGLELDKVRVAMETLESSEQKTVRLAYSTAVKVGNVTKPVTIWNEDGTVVNNLDFTGSYVTLNRSGFRIQQDVPYDPSKSSIREVTQASKNLFINMGDVTGFKVPWLEGEYTGKELQQVYNDLHRELFVLGKNELLDKVVENGMVNIQELKKMIKEESIKRGYSISDRLLIDLDDNLEFLPFSSIADKYSAVLNALVYDRVLKQKIHGKSFVLGSAEGFITDKDAQASYIKETPGIIFTDSWEGFVNTTSENADGTIKPAQVLVPWKFKDNKGNKLDIKAFINSETGRIDFSRLPKDILKGFGMRIPNQGPNSQLAFEIVGFLPETSGDLIIAPEDLIVQMGSDFDVDKLYTYTYNTFFKGGYLYKNFPEGDELLQIQKNLESLIGKYKLEISLIKLENKSLQDKIDELFESFKLLGSKKLTLSSRDKKELRAFEEEELTELVMNIERNKDLKETTKSGLNEIIGLYNVLKNSEKFSLQNKILDIHLAVHYNNNIKVQEQIAKPLDSWILEKEAKNIDNARRERNPRVTPFTGLSDTYQRSKFLNATAGKKGCLGYGTKVLMYDGSFKEVQDIVVGDLVMGVDSTPRTVLELKRGIEQMYWVRQNKGIDYRVNESHILSLKMSLPAVYSNPLDRKTFKRFIDRTKLLREKEISTINISVNDVLSKNKNFLNISKGYKSTGIDFLHKDVSIDPYYIGLWLGDGVTKDIKEVATVEEEITNYLKATFGIKSTYGKNNISKRLFKDKLNDNFKKEFNTIKSGLPPNGKYIPDNYLYTSKENRLKLLAGLIDSDGNYCGINKQYSFSNINKTLIDQVLFLTRSLGFYSSVTIKPAQTSKRGLKEQELYTIRFIPECDIPVLLPRKRQVIKSNFKNRLYTGIKIEKDTVDNYYGFVLDGDHLFMLEDFTVTHNTGIFSLDSMFNAVAQTVDTLKYKSTKKDVFEVRFGHNISYGKLNEVNCIDDKSTYISTVIAGYQSGAVDNEKLQILDKLNINSETFGVIKLLNQLGFSNTTVYFIAQDIIFDYVEELQRLKGSVGEFVANVEDTALKNVLAKYPSEAEDVDFDKEMTPANLKSMIKWDKDTDGNFVEPVNYRAFQRAVLSKFLYLKDKSDSLSSIQTTINVDSKGFGKSIIESNLREESFWKLIDSPIEGATKLIGEVKKISLSEVNDMKANGFIIRANPSDNSLYAIKPTTIPGMAIVEGLFTNNDLWNSVYPTATSGISNTFLEVEKILGLEDKSFNAKSALRYDVWNSIKSYLFTNPNTIVNNVDSRRKDLLIDVVERATDYDETGLKYETVTVKHQSLATIVSKIKELKSMQANSFIQRLEVELNSNGKPSLVIFNSSARENMDESQLYTDFLDLFIRNRSLGIFNGEEYDTNQLAQELVEYSYLNGGIQEALQFIKYISPSYLKSTGFISTITNTNLNTPESIGLGINSEATPYWYTSPFTTQYIQHNPGKIKARLTNLSELDRVDNGYVLNEAGSRLYITIYTSEGSEQVPPPFLSLYDNNVKNDKKYRIFKYDGNVYNEVAVLGGKGVDEYNFNVLNQNSIISPISSTQTQTLIEKAPQVPEASKTLPNEAPIRLSDKLKLVSSNNGRAKVKEMLGHIMSESGYYGTLAEIYSNLLDETPNFTLEVLRQSPKFGSWDSKTLMLTKDAIDGGTVEQGFRGILHEVTHILTTYILTNPDKANAQQRKAIAKLNNIFNQYVEIVKQDPEYANYKKRLEAFKKANLAGKGSEEWNKYISDESLRISEEDKAKYYPAENVKEFVAQAMADVNFQKILNSIIDKNSDTKSLWQQLKDIVRRLIDSIVDFNIDENSLLASALNNVMELFNEDAVISKPSNIAGSINIYAGTNENADLSNFAIRPFEVQIATLSINDDIDAESERVLKELKGLKFNTVEGAFQAAKLAYALDLGAIDVDSYTTNIEKLQVSKGNVAKSIGKNTKIDKVIDIGDNFFDRWDEVSSYIMKELILESFKQNPQALERLLSTGNATLTHTQDKGKWGTEFPRLLMEVRDELSTTTPQSIEATTRGIEVNIGNIYNQLGNKTQSENVVIRSWGELKEVKEPIQRRILNPLFGEETVVIATRIPNTNEHFGNPFSHDPVGKTQGLIKTDTIKEAVESYINWVLSPELDINIAKDLSELNDNYGISKLAKFETQKKWIREQLKSGNLKGKSILYYKELGEPSHATALDYLINKYNWGTPSIVPTTKTFPESKSFTETGKFGKEFDTDVDEVVEEFLPNTIPSNKVIEELMKKCK